MRSAILLLLVAEASAYLLASRPSPAAARASSVSMALPELYVYDHCPFCVRVRVALGVMGVDYKVI